MIKIVKKPDEVKEVKCDCCGCTLEYGNNDVCVSVTTKRDCILCPNCGSVVMLKDNGFKPDKWPNDYYQYGGPEAKALTDEEIRNYIEECVENTKKHKDIAYIACGDSFVLTLPDCDDLGEIESITAIVARGYKEGLVYERED